MSNPATEPLVLVERAGAIASIILNRPKSRNSADLPMSLALLDSVRQVCYDPEIKVVLLRSSSAHFMSGGDVKRFGALLQEPDQGQDEFAAIIDAVNQITLSLTQAPSLVVGLVSGSVAGVGCSLAMACDVLIAASDTRFVLAYNGLGASPDGGASWLLPRVVGLQRALAMVLLNQPLDAQEAHSAGMVTQIVPVKDLLGAGIDVANRLAAGPAQAQAASKALLRKSLTVDLPTALESEKTSFLAVSQHSDFAEGVNAFLERRAALFATTPTR